MNAAGLRPLKLVLLWVYKNHLAVEMGIFILIDSVLRDAKSTGWIINDALTNNMWEVVCTHLINDSLGRDRRIGGFVI